nr:hypothetical protein Iba_chr12bCG16430 [Ipomoea batatas]
MQQQRASRPNQGQPRPTGGLGLLKRRLRVAISKGSNFGSPSLSSVAVGREAATGLRRWHAVSLTLFDNGVRRQRRSSALVMAGQNGCVLPCSSSRWLGSPVRTSRRSPPCVVDGNGRTEQRRSKVAEHLGGLDIPATLFRSASGSSSDRSERRSLLRAVCKAEYSSGGCSSVTNDDELHSLYSSLSASSQQHQWRTPAASGSPDAVRGYRAWSRKWTVATVAILPPWLGGIPPQLRFLLPWSTSKVAAASMSGKERTKLRRSVVPPFPASCAVLRGSVAAAEHLGGLDISGVLLRLADDRDTGDLGLSLRATFRATTPDGWSTN